MKKKKEVFIGIALGIIILLLIEIFVVLLTKDLVVEKDNKEETKTTETSTAIEGPIEVVKEENIPGKYEQKIENDNTYYSSIIVISNKTETTIDFEIDTAHGMDIDHVNIGNLKGTAIKSESNLYIFEEKKEGETSQISFEFEVNKLTIIEKYPNNINPYAGHGVYFAGEYNKVS